MNNKKTVIRFFTIDGHKVLQRIGSDDGLSSYL